MKKSVKNKQKNGKKMINDVTIIAFTRSFCFEIIDIVLAMKPLKCLH